MSLDIGPAYHPEDASYLVRWHQHREDVPSDPTDLLHSTWTDSATGKVVNHADFPPPPKEPELALE